jgi:glycosyltransferase involved in cell wall biosynthesis
MPRHEEQLFANGAGRNYALSTGMLGTSYAGVVKRCCCERVPQDLDRRPTPFPTTAASAPHGAARRMHAFATALRARADEGALHVVLVSHSFDLDGAPVYLLQLAGWLLQQGHRVLCTAPTDGRLRAQLLALGAQTAVVQGLHVGRRSQWESLYAALQQLPPFSSPDFVVFNTVIWADLMFAHDKLRWCRRAPRIVWVIHELELDDAHKTMTGYWWGHDFATLRSAPLLRRTHLSADAVVFVSEAQRAIWQRYDHVHFHVIPGHAEHVLQPIRPPLALPSRSALGVSASAFLISVIGTFCVRKRQGLALDALENILAKGGDAHLLLVGAPSELGGMGGEAAYIMMLQKRATSPALQGRVTFVPFERSGWRYSAIADLHVSASTHEAYPLSTLEAMRQGVPVIATAAGGTAEQFPSDDVAWMVAPIRPSEHFIAAIERAHGLHQRGQLKRLGELQQRFSAGAAGRFSEGWAQLVERLLYASRVNDACQLWTAEDEESCVVGGRRAGVGPRR